MQTHSTTFHLALTVAPTVRDHPVIAGTELATALSPLLERTDGWSDVVAVQLVPTGDTPLHSKSHG
jgi:hypothetical protein